MNVQEYFDFIVNQIHSAVFATVDCEGRPVTCAIDLMDYDENGLYFLTAKGKNFYDRLKANENIAFTAMKGEDTLSCVAVSVQGKAKEIGPAKLPALFNKNPYMERIYPDVRSRSAVTVFKIYEGTGEWFDLSKLPIERASFSFGGAQTEENGYFVTDKCIGCKLCYSKCPQKCIDITQKPVVIRQEHCLRCGNCFEICPAKAIERRQ
ncbi:4Fe-4S binding protein [Intestinimonas timonensis]|uniref:4Fe-4S binding protein n=1 Tax=Intestinimonas timonensis TaxID=1689270 RepID=UPI003A8FA3C3